MKHLSWWREPSLNLALNWREISAAAARVPAAVSQTRDCECSVEWAEEYSTILADPRCVLNIKSSAVIPLAAPNTNRGLPVATATALLSNIASSGSASLSVSLFPSPIPCSSFCHPPCCFIFCVACVNTTTWCVFLPTPRGYGVTSPMLLAHIQGLCL